MKIKSSKEKKQSPKSDSHTSIIIISLIIIIIALLFFLWHQSDFYTSKDEDQKTFLSTTSTEESQNTNKPDDTETQKNIDDITKVAPLKIIRHTEPLNEDQPQTIPLTSDEPEKTSNVPVTKSAPPVIKQNSGFFTKTCSESNTIIHAFYSHLDTQTYMKPYGLEASSEQHFTKLIQKLLDNPPVVSGETNDLYTILQNTAHFYRVIGKKNILILKGILDREKDQFEQVLNHYYSIFHIPACPENSYKLKVPKDSLYEYAGFFLNTMGGRLYLFRRDSKSRIVVNYYAILLIDQANKEARNKHGVEIKVAVDQLITEIEASSGQLKLKELYLDNLYTLKELYQ